MYSLSHESGHTFGAVHDCDLSTCSASQSPQCCPLSSSGCDAGDQYIMSPISRSSLTEFSPCTVGNICSALGRNSVRSSCLVNNRNETTIPDPQCGNGVIEAGEDCDCGSDESCSENPCCNPNTCRFVDGAVCSDSDGPCCLNCQFASSSTICRPSTGPCDIEEVCTGSSGSCPTNSYRPNGQSCGNSTGLSCISGRCTSRDLQCQSAVDQSTNRNYTRACDIDSCTLKCYSPDYTGYCVSVNQNFLDGTPCSTDGRCSNGGCEGASPVNNGSSWLDNHRALIIGIASGVGGLVLLIVCYFIFKCCRRQKHIQISIPVAPLQQPSMRYQYS